MTGLRRVEMSSFLLDGRKEDGVTHEFSGTANSRPSRPIRLTYTGHGRDLIYHCPNLKAPIIAMTDQALPQDRQHYPSATYCIMALVY
jgi:hypothetical protein